MINIDLTARLSDYGFVQLADCVEDSDKERAGTCYCENLSQKSDIFNFGLVLLDMLAGVREPGYIKWILDTKESIKQGKSMFFRISCPRERTEASFKGFGHCSGLYKQVSRGQAFNRANPVES